MKKLLIAEDDIFLANAYKAKLSKTGFEIGLATDGEEMLAMIDSFNPDAILLDLMMPKMDGFSLLEKLRGMSQYKTIPIIVASNLGQKEDIDRAMSMGASGYIVKSNLSLSDLVDKINTFLPNSKEKTV